MAVVLVTDAKQRKSIPIIRSLGRQGVPVISADDSRFSMGFYSKYCRQSLLCPSPENHPEAFVDWLLTLGRGGVYDILFAIDELTLDVVTKHLDALTPYVAVPAVDHPTYLKARDKGEAITLAQSLGIACPQTAVVKSPADLQEIADNWQFPLVIKPRRSSGSRGLMYVQEPHRLQDAYQSIAQSFPDPLIQEYIPPGGDTLGVEVLMNRQGEARATFVHRRLREYPIAGGPSTLRESVAAPSLVELGVRLLKGMGWVGVAMVEFKVDPRDGVPKLMEVNPKFWGSIALPIAAGVDFPYLLYRMALDGDVEPVTAYEIGVRCRWLLPGDILHFIHNPDRFRLNPSFFTFKGDKLYYDLICRDDPGPLWGMFCQALSSLANPTFRKKYLAAKR
jgi:predicted ATP-grasp superfamily ATP-dependent carboligase